LKYGCFYAEQSHAQGAERTEDVGAVMADWTTDAVDTLEQIVDAVRGGIGADTPLVFRFSQWKMSDYDARLAETAPVHARGVSKLFVDQLDDQELALVEQALNKVILDCSFG